MCCLILVRIRFKMLSGRNPVFALLSCNPIQVWSLLWYLYFFPCKRRSHSWCLLALRTFLTFCLKRSLFHYFVSALSFGFILELEPSFVGLCLGLLPQTRCCTAWKDFSVMHSACPLFPHLSWFCFSLLVLSWKHLFHLRLGNSLPSKPVCIVSYTGTVSSLRHLLTASLGVLVAVEQSGLSQASGASLRRW